MIDLTIMVPLILGIVSSVKMVGMDAKYAPALSVVLGIIMFYFFADGLVTARIFEGLVAGLSASGLYSGVKTVLTR